MSIYTANEIHLINRPSGLPSHSDVEQVQRELEPPASGQVLIRNLYMSVDPYMRGRMRENAVYAQAYQLNKPMYGGAIGEVIESNSDRVKAGDIVLNQGAWRTVSSPMTATSLCCSRLIMTAFHSIWAPLACPA